MATATPLDGPLEVTAFIEDLNVNYEKVHKAFEDNFWSTKMGLQGCSSEALAKTKTDLDAFLGDPERLKSVRENLKRQDISEAQRHVLRCVERTLLCYITEDAAVRQMQEALTEKEAALQLERNAMKLGYVDPVTDKFVPASSVLLREVMRTSEDERKRKACWEGLRSIGPFVSKKFLEIVVLRNKMARARGYEDFYDFKVTQAEGFGKRRLFEILDDLEFKTRDLVAAARARLAADKGESALEPWNTGYATAGDVAAAEDPYFPFELAVDVWARSFAAMGVRYSGAVMTLDLCDRDNKYSNGFCHWPQPAWRRADGRWVPSRANFTSLATPSAIGSGKTALATLMHEGGHAAHFANVDQRSPLFSQERAPTSVAYAENQSMFLDSVVRDAAWQAKYARSRDGSVIPWSVVERGIRAVWPYEVFQLRAMLSVCYFEKALYEADVDALTPEGLLALADETERRVQGGLAGRPLLSVPHILSDESSCYYHGYVLAEMSVYQTRSHFLRKYGAIVDNEQVGRDLCGVYWRPGNGASFLALVEQLTGAPLAADAWVEELNTDLEQHVGRERAAYEAALAAGPKLPPGAAVDLDMAVRVVHGDELVADSQQLPGGFREACTTFTAWVRDRFFKQAAAVA